MKPRVINAVPDMIFEAADANTWQDRTKDLAKCNGVWLVNEPKVWSTNPFATSGEVVVEAHYGLVLDGVELAPKGETTVTLLNQFAHTGWYYLYARNDGADGVEYFWDDQVPDDGHGILLGDANRRVAEVYVLSSTSGAEEIRHFRYAHGETIHDWGLNPTTSTIFDNYSPVGGALGGTGGNVSLLNFIPPTSRSALVHMVVHQNNNAVGTTFKAGVGPKGSGSIASFPSYQLIASGRMSAALDDRHIEGWIQTDENLDINYGVSGDAGIGVRLLVKGYKR